MLLSLTCQLTIQAHDIRTITNHHRRGSSAGGAVGPKAILAGELSISRLAIIAAFLETTGWQVARHFLLPLLVVIPSPLVVLSQLLLFVLLLLLFLFLDVMLPKFLAFLFLQVFLMRLVAREHTI